MEGQFRPGDRLPSERELAELLNVSRTVVRAAIAVLEREGRVQVRRGRFGGFTVQAPDLGSADARRLLRANKTSVQNALEYRVVLESATARMAAQRRRVKDLNEMRGLLKLMDRAFDLCMTEQTPSHVFDFEKLDAAFHEAVAAATNNNVMVDMVAAARRLVWAPVGGIFWRLEEKGHKPHWGIFEAVEAQDGDLAAERMTEHISDTKDSIASWLKR